MDHGYDFNRVIATFNRYDTRSCVLGRWRPNRICGIQRFCSIRFDRMADHSLNQETEEIKGRPLGAILLFFS